MGQCDGNLAIVLTDLKLRDVEGHDEMDAGCNEVKFDASQQPSGLYFYRLRAGGYVATRKLLLVK